MSLIGRWGSETGSPGQAFPLPLPQFTALVNGQVWCDGVDEISCHKPVTSQGSGKVGSSSQPPPLQKNWFFKVMYQVLFIDTKELPSQCCWETMGVNPGKVLSTACKTQ